MGTANGTYGAPWNTSMSGGVLYNKDIYAELGLEIPTTWDEFIANSEKIKDAGKAAPIIQTYGDTWTSQMWVLADFYNVLAQNPDWAQQYTENKVHYSEQPAFNGFGNLEQAAKSGLFNKDFASATYDDAIKMLADRDRGPVPDADVRGAELHPELPGRGGQGRRLPAARLGRRAATG